MEINPRLAGDCIPDLVEMATGVNMVEAVLDQAVGISIQIETQRSKSAAIQFCIPEQLGTYVEIHNVEQAENVTG